MNSTESWLDAVGRVGAAIVAHHLAAVWQIMIRRCYLKIEKFQSTVEPRISGIFGHSEIFHYCNCEIFHFFGCSFYI